MHSVYQSTYSLICHPAHTVAKMVEYMKLMFRYIMYSEVQQLTEDAGRAATAGAYSGGALGGSATGKMGHTAVS